MKPAGSLGHAVDVAVTVIADEPVLPSDVAVTVAEPTATPVTRPLAFTVATDGLELPHVMVRPVSTLPEASRNVAVNCLVAPLATLADAGATVTWATGRGVPLATILTFVGGAGGLGVDEPDERQPM